MFVFCLILGITMIGMSLSLLIAELMQTKQFKLTHKMARPLSSKKLEKLKAQRARVSSTIDSEYELNVDSFVGLEPLPKIEFDDVHIMECQSALDYHADDDLGEDRPSPALRLASLMEIQNEERLMTRYNANKPLEMLNGKPQNQAVTSEKPAVLGDCARKLGLQYLQELIDHRVVPRGRVSATNESNLVIAQNALRAKTETHQFEHGAIAQTIGTRSVCIFEPLEKAITNVDRVIPGYKSAIQDKVAFFVLSNTANVPAEYLRHIRMVCKEFSIPQANIFIQQPDNSFVNYTEDSKNFVPARIDVSCMPESFFEQLLDYAHSAYDEGDNDTVLRVLGPLMDDLYARVQNDKRFSKLLAAQAFNLMGMTNRALDCDEFAVRCFETSLALLRVIEDYNAIKSVQANLGISYAIMRPITPLSLEQAVRHLNEVTQLNPYDDESWVYLGNSYLEQFKLCQQKTSLLHHALHAYERAEALSPSEEITACVTMLRTKLGVRTNAARSVAAPATVSHRAKNSVMHA